MKGFWLEKFNELAKFNSKKDKSKYNYAYFEKMANLQKEYDKRIVDYKKEHGSILA